MKYSLSNSTNELHLIGDKEDWKRFASDLRLGTRSSTLQSADDDGSPVEFVISTLEVPLIMIAVTSTDCLTICGPSHLLNELAAWADSLCETVGSVASDHLHVDHIGLPDVVSEDSLYMIWVVTDV